MDVNECVLTRKSIRAFKSIPVPKDLLYRILNEARRSTSAANTQPWEFIVFGGQVMQEMKKAYQERLLSGIEVNKDIPYDKSAWPEPYRSRREETGQELYISMGIKREEKDKRQQFRLRGADFWGAPNGMLICIDGSLVSPVLPWPLLDVGGILQTILLLAHNYGLGCCVQGQMTEYPDIIRGLMNIPSSKKIVIGLAIGYPDEDDPVNKHISDRVPLEEIVTWYGI